MREQNGKKRYMMGIVLLLLMLCVVSPMKAKAETLEDQVTQAVAFGEFDELTLKVNDPIVLKVVLKEKGSFILDFTPQSVWVAGELYDEQSQLIKSWGGFGSASYKSLEAKGLGAGTYYLRLWARDRDAAGTHTYFARFTPSGEASMELCINLKKGKSIQLGTIFNNCNDKDVTWSSSKKAIATVSSKGKVTGKKKGTTEIKVFNSSGLVVKIKVKVVS